MSTPGRDDETGPPPAPAVGVVGIDLRARQDSATEGRSDGPVRLLLREALATPGIRCLLLVLDGTATGIGDDAVLVVAEASVPVVATLHGEVGARAAALALAADLRVAAADSTLRTEPLVGGTSVTVPRAAGEATARLLLLAPRAVTAHDALRLGLVHEVHDPDRVDAAAEALAATVARRAGLGAAVRRALAPEGCGAQVARAIEDETRLRGVVDLHPAG